LFVFKCQLNGYWATGWLRNRKREGITELMKRLRFSQICIWAAPHLIVNITSDLLDNCSLKLLRKWFKVNVEYECHCVLRLHFPTNTKPIDRTFWWTWVSEDELCLQSKNHSFFFRIFNCICPSSTGASRHVLVIQQSVNNHVIRCTLDAE
jgi:hypothetical protein